MKPEQTVINESDWIILSEYFFNRTNTTNRILKVAQVSGCTRIGGWIKFTNGEQLFLHPEHMTNIGPAITELDRLIYDIL